MDDHRIPALVLTGLALALASPATAQTKSPPKPSAGVTSPDVEDEDEATVSELVVTAPTARPQPGAVVGDIRPEVQLGPAEIQSYGVSSVTDLLNELAPQIRSDRGRGGEAPVVLLNGRRISGFSEIRDLPTEAILRVDILPEEVALKYGYSADQRVVNIVLRRRFRALSTEGDLGAPTEGGQTNGTAELGLTHIRGDNRLNVDLKAQAASAITENERDIRPLDGETPGDDRTLAPETREVSLNTVYARVLPHDVRGTINATLDASQSRSLLGLPGAALGIPEDDAFAPSGAAADLFGPLRQEMQAWTGHLGGTLNRDLRQWRFTVTGAYDHAANQTDSDVDPSGLPAERAEETATSNSDAVEAHALASGPVWRGPSGPLYASVRVGEAGAWFTSDDERPSGRQSADLSRNTLSAQANLDLPLTSRSKHVLGFVGDLSINGNAAVNDLSDFGTLKTLGFGMNWTPVTGVNLIVSHTHDEAAPTMQQLGGPVITTEGARVFDFTTGQTVAVRRLDGGNPDLVADDRELTKIGLTLKPLRRQDLTITANYIASRIGNAIATFPAATAELEAAFPDRFIRDASGTLAEVDNRPVNFAQETRRELRWGINYSRPIGPQPQRRFPPLGGGGRPRPDSGGDATNADGSRAGGSGGRGGFGGRGGGFGGGAGGRLQFAIYHTIYFDDRILVRDGGPVLDLLHGGAAGSGGGQPRQEIEAQAGFTEHGLGARISANWQDATFVRGDPGSPVGDLRFSSLAKVNLRLFANLGQMRDLVAKEPWLRGSRLTFSVTNLFDAHKHVRDASGLTPISYQADELDPIGRVAAISFRKLFY